MTTIHSAQHVRPKSGRATILLLDTHVWYWWATSSEQLPLSFKEEIEIQFASGIYVSSISCWEVSRKAARGRLELGMDLNTWMSQALELQGVEVLPITPEIAVLANALPGQFHHDPADELIVATAIHFDMTLMTKDQKIPDIHTSSYSSKAPKNPWKKSPPNTPLTNCCPPPN